jgi:hypothetical protein
MKQNDIVLYTGPLDLDFFNPEGERIEELSMDGEFAVIKGRLLPIQNLRKIGDANWLFKQLGAVKNHLRYCMTERSYYSTERKKEVIQSCKFIFGRLNQLAQRLFGADSVKGLGM